jgi:hypothetical protein
MQQIDRMQTLIELKSVAPATALPQQDATACDTSTLQRAKSSELTENKKENIEKSFQSVALPQQDATACDNSTLQHATVQNMAVPQPKKRGLFSRVLDAVLSDD